MGRREEKEELLRSLRGYIALLGDAEDGRDAREAMDGLWADRLLREREDRRRRPRGGRP